MSASVTATDVVAELNYLRPTTERPRTFTYAPPDGAPRSTSVADPRRIRISDIRAAGRDFLLDLDGFTVVRHHSRVTDFASDAEIRSIYYPEAEQLIRDLTGADQVYIFDHTLRRRVPGAEDERTGVRQPATRVHVDHTETSGPQRVRDLLPNEADELLKGRVQVINLWRPINHPVYDAPLAVAEAGSVAFSDLVPSDLIYPNRVGETYNVMFNPAHRWHYVSEQQPDEVLLLKCYDSREDVARFLPHTAFVVPDVPAGLPPRESIELRTLVFHR